MTKTEKGEGIGRKNYQYHNITSTTSIRNQGMVRSLPLAPLLGCFGTLRGELLHNLPGPIVAAHEASQVI